MSDDRMEGEGMENEEEKKARIELEQFALIEDILAAWEPKERLPGGRYCGIEELFEIVEQESPSSFASSSSLRDFISARPHIFRITKAEEVAVRMKEERTNFIRAVRFVRESSPSTRELIEKFWEKDAEKLKLKEEEENKNRDEDERMTRWMLHGGRWAKAAVLRSIKRGGEGIFTVDGDSISLTVDALANDSLFNDIYLNYADAVVKNQKEKADNANKDDGVKVEKTVHKQRQTNSSQICLLAFSKETKPKYGAGLSLSPDEYNGETVYILPNQIGLIDLKAHCGQLMIIRAHDVIGDESLAHRFRADEVNIYPFVSYAKVFGELSHDFQDSKLRPLLKFSGDQKHLICAKQGENQSEEYARLQSEMHGEEIEDLRCSVNCYSDYIIPTKTGQFEWNSRCAFEKFFVDELDHLIKSGIKSRVEHGEEKEEKPYPIDILLEDVICRSITTPDALPLLIDETREELLNELEMRPHLYFIHERSSPSASVSLRNRHSIDRLLRCLDTEAVWTMNKLRMALGEGRAGEEWKDEPLEELVSNLLDQVMSRDQECMSLALKKSRDGLWLRGTPAMVRRGTKMEKSEETKMRVEDKRYGEWTISDDGVKMKGRGMRAPRMLTPVSDEEEEEGKENDEEDEKEEVEVLVSE